MRTAVLALALAAGCTRARSPSATIRAPFAPEPSRDVPVPGWTRVAPRDRPPRLDAVAALGDGGAVMLADTEVYRLAPGGAVTLACTLDPALPVTGLQTVGPRWWALAGEAFDPVVFHGGDDPTTCARSSLPPLVARDAPPGMLRSAQAGAEAVVWSSAGPMARSRDGALTWERIPSLAEVVAVTASAGTLYAAALLGGPGSRAPFDRHGYEVFGLPDGATRWEPLPTPGDRATPVALLPRPSGGVLGLDVLGGFEIAADGAGLVGLSRGPHFARDRPRLLVAATLDSAVGQSGTTLFEYRLTGWRPLPALPGERVATTFAAAPGGAWVIADAHELWRLREGAEPEVLLRAPLAGGRPTRLAVRGPVIAALTGRDRLSVSRDGGATWTSVVIPPDGGIPRSLAVLTDGVVAVVAGGTSAAATGAIWIADPTLHRVDLPRGARVVEGGATLRAIGQRWLLAAGDVFVSDDEGARWRLALGAPTGASEAWSVVGLAAAEGRIAFALDASGALWRSDDAGDQFMMISPGREGSASGRAALQHAPPATTSDWLQWDGGDAIIASSSRQLVRFDRDGHGVPLGTLRGVNFGAAVEDGAIIAASALTGRVSECGPDSDTLLLAVTTDHDPTPIADVCAHQAVAFAVDGDALYTADSDGAIERASLRGLWRAARARAAP